MSENRIKDKKGKSISLGFPFLTVTIEHHATISTCNIGAGKIPAGIFISNNRFVYIIHWIDGDLVGFSI